MDERKDPEPPAERRPPVAAATRLSPVQEAWRAYVVHSLHNCLVCRRVDGSPCPAAEALYRVYRELADGAFDQMAGEAPPHRQ